jgi:biotin synthase
MPLSMVRLSAGRESMSEMTQAMCFMAGANSIFTGDTLLTAPNAGDDKDGAMFARLGITPMAVSQTQAQAEAERMPRGCARLEAAE